MKTKKEEIMQENREMEHRSERRKEWKKASRRAAWHQGAQKYRREENRYETA